MLEKQTDDAVKASILQKIEQLPPRGVSEVDMFVDFLRLRYREEGKLTSDFLSLSAEVWDDE